MKATVIVGTLFLICLLLSTFSPVLGTKNEVGNIPNQSAESGILKFGIVYLSTSLHYESRYLSNETIDRDFRLFRKQGLEYVTLVAVWSYLEPTLGTYNDLAFEDILRVCDFAAKYNLRIIIDFYTMMQQDSFTMPKWMYPQKFETVFTNATVRQAWLDYLDHCASYLNGSESIWSWHMMNEPAIGNWACNVTVNDFIQLWTEMRAIFKSYSERPVSIRFAAQVFDSPLQFDRDARIYQVCDYMALNWYENETRNCTEQLLESLVPEIHQYGEGVMISEFGFDTTAWNCTDQYQTEKYGEYIKLFEQLGVASCISWMWRADYQSTNPQIPGTGFNLAENLEGEPRPAFYQMSVALNESLISTDELSLWLPMATIIAGAVLAGALSLFIIAVADRKRQDEKKQLVYTF